MFKNLLAALSIIFFSFILTSCNLVKKENREKNNAEVESKESPPVFQTELEKANTRAGQIQEEDIIWQFFDYINKQKIDQALGLMSKNLLGDETSQKIWREHFQAIKSINVQNIEPYNKENWTENNHIYKTALEAYVAAEAEKAPIPFYGWQDNPNIRWIELQKIETPPYWLINSISTGP